MVFQAVGKIYHVRYYEDYVWCLNFIQKLYNVHANARSRARTEYIQKCAIFTEFLFKFILVVVLLALLVYFLYPLYVYVTKNKLIPLGPLYLPGIDETTTTGYLILFMFHCALIYVALVGFSAFELLMEIIVISSLIFGKLIAIDTELISNDLIDERRRDAIHRLSNLFLMHQEMCG